MSFFEFSWDTHTCVCMCVYIYVYMCVPINTFLKETQRLCFPGILILFFFPPEIRWIIEWMNSIIHQLWALRIRFNFTSLLPQVLAMRDFSRLCFVLHCLAHWGKRENWYQFRNVNSYEPPTVWKALCLLGAWKAVLFHRAHTLLLLSLLILAAKVE